MGILAFEQPPDLVELGFAAVGGPVLTTFGLPGITLLISGWA